MATDSTFTLRRTNDYLSFAPKAKLTRVDISVIDRVCTALNCQPCDLIEHIPDEN